MNTRTSQHNFILLKLWKIKQNKENKKYLQMKYIIHKKNLLSLLYYIELFDKYNCINN